MFVVRCYRYVVTAFICVPLPFCPTGFRLRCRSYVGPLLAVCAALWLLPVRLAVDCLVLARLVLRCVCAVLTPSAVV